MITENRISELASVALSAGPDTYLLVQESIRLADAEATERAIETAKRCRPEDTVQALCRLRDKTPNAELTSRRAED